MTMQAFHTAAPEKIEVLDSESDLILYDVDKHEVTTIEQAPNELEIFPAWSPDGKWLYFCSAHFVYQSDSVDRSEITMRANEVRYNIYRKSFDAKTRQFGKREMVFCADTLGKSATFPRLSPDGRWLLFTLGEWGCFHIWHHDADLWMKDLKTGEVRAMDEMNSDDTESYHSWSSNGRWVVFSSRRYDGVFTRPFIAHIDAQGRGSKPFELPAKDPDLHRQFLKSYNVPELMKGPVKLSPQEVASKLKDDGKPITYKSK
jgi:dipeptidyl aminopeptidase/acylaminoacyl peptidase